MNKHASLGCIDANSTTGNMGMDCTKHALIVRATKMEMRQVFIVCGYIFGFPESENKLKCQLEQRNVISWKTDNKYPQI